MDPEGFEVVSVVIQNGIGGPPTWEDAELWGDGLDLTFTVVADADGSFTPVYNPQVILPMAYIIDPDGVIVWTEAGGAGGLDEIEETVRANLP